MSSSLGGYGGLRGPTGQIGNKTPSGTRVGQISQYTPEQQQLYQQSFAQASPDSYLSRLAGGDQSMFGEIEAPALRQFNELQGGLASRFSGMGMGSRRSSGFQNTASSAASNFAQELQANRQNLQRQAMTDLRGLTGELLNYRPFETFGYEKQKKKGVDWGGLGGAVLGGVGGFFAGNPIGGAALGYNVGSSAFGGGGSGGSGNYGSFGSFKNPFSGGGGEGAAYDQEFRTNPAAMGF